MCSSNNFFFFIILIKKKKKLILIYIKLIKIRYTSQLFLNFKKKGDKTEIEQLGTSDGYFPVQILFCLKEKNKKKVKKYNYNSNIKSLINILILSIDIYSLLKD